jgi:hypothetical protein
MFTERNAGCIKHKYGGCNFAVDKKDGIVMKCRVDCV